MPVLLAFNGLKTWENYYLSSESIDKHGLARVFDAHLVVFLKFLSLVVFQIPFFLYQKFPKL